MDLSKLNKEQKTAVEHRKGPLLVLSGAGTGKTRVLTSRFVYIVKNIKTLNLLQNYLNLILIKSVKTS